MGVEDNKALVRRCIEEPFNQRRTETIDELVSSDYVSHDPANPGIRGPQGFRQLVNMYLTAFPDSHFTIEDQVAEGDKVVTRWTARGTHRGTLQGIAPTNKTVNVTGITFSRVANGKLAEDYANWDTIGLFQQLGVVPQLSRTGA
jgi:steroid delta-isomerase-like uncharacterized protein